MKLALVLHGTDAETAWNAFRLGLFALKQGDAVNVFLLARGVDCASLDTPDFPVRALMGDFVDGGGRILACGTCLQHRGREGSELCPVSTMKDLYGLVRDADKVLSF